MPLTYWLNMNVLKLNDLLSYFSSCKNILIFYIWLVTFRTTDFSLRSQNADDSKPPHFPKSARSKSGKTLKYNEHNDQNVEMEVPSRQKSSINNLQNLETVKSSASAPIIDRVPSASGKGTNAFETGNRVSSAKQRPPSSRPVSRAKTSQSRPGSRAKSRASSRLNG